LHQFSRKNEDAQPIGWVFFFENGTINMFGFHHYFLLHSNIK